MNLQIFQNNNFRYPLFILVAVDFMFFALHLLLKFGVLSNQMFDIGLDNSAGEYYQYTKFFSIVILLGIAYTRFKDKVFIPWLFLFLYLLFDDIFSMHETAGESLAKNLNLPSLFMMDPLDLGEILFSGTIGVLFLAGILLVSLSAQRRSKEISLVLCILLCTLAFFGMFIDTLHSIVDNMHAHLWVSGSFSLVEDGGEHLTVSVITAFLIAVNAMYSKKGIGKNTQVNSL